MRFKIGDKVKLRDDLEVGRCYGGLEFLSRMEGLKGKEITIDRISRQGNYIFKEGCYYYSEEMLKKVKGEISMDREKKYIVSFSGGKDSTAMLLLLIENGEPIDEIIFCDTGMEFKDMYNHIEKVKEMIDLPITVLKSDKSFEYYMFEHVKTKGKNKGQKGYSWCDFRNRWCTKALKKTVISKYLRNKYPKDKYEVIEYHGIALDEKQRAEKNKEKICVYPLIEYGMTEKDALEYCYSKGLDWGGLYEKFGRVSCWCCPLKSLKELKVLYEEYPEYWAKLKEWDNKTYRQFRSDYSIEDLEKKFKKERRG